MAKGDPVPLPSFGDPSMEDLMANKIAHDELLLFDEASAIKNLETRNQRCLVVF